MKPGLKSALSGLHTNYPHKTLQELAQNCTIHYTPQQQTQKDHLGHSYGIDHVKFVMRIVHWVVGDVGDDFRGGQGVIRKFSKLLSGEYQCQLSDWGKLAVIF